MTSRQYKATSVVTPPDARGRIADYDHCVFTVSVGAANLSHEKLAAGFEWAAKRYSGVAVYVLDRICRVTRQFPPLNSRDEEELCDQREGTKVIEAIESILGKRFDGVLRYCQLCRTPLFRSAQRQVNWVLETHPAILGMIEEESRTYVERQQRTGRLIVPAERAFELGVDYLKDEMAMQIVLVKLGWIVEVYVGRELTPLADLATGSYEDVPPELRNRINIGLALRTGVAP